MHRYPKQRKATTVVHIRHRTLEPSTVALMKWWAAQGCRITPFSRRAPWMPRWQSGITVHCPELDTKAPRDTPSACDTPPSTGSFIVLLILAALSVPVSACWASLVSLVGTMHHACWAPCVNPSMYVFAVEGTMRKHPVKKAHARNLNASIFSNGSRRHIRRISKVFSTSLLGYGNSKHPRHKLVFVGLALRLQHPTLAWPSHTRSRR